MTCTKATAAMIGLPIILEKQVLLGIIIDYELKFDDHVNYLRKKQVKNLMPVLHLLQMLAKHELS